MNVFEQLRIGKHDRFVFVTGIGHDILQRDLLIRSQEVHLHLLVSPAADIADIPRAALIGLPGEYPDHGVHGVGLVLLNLEFKFHFRLCLPLKEWSSFYAKSKNVVTLY